MIKTQRVGQFLDVSGFLAEPERMGNRFEILCYRPLHKWSSQTWRENRTPAVGKVWGLSPPLPQEKRQPGIYEIFGLKNLWQPGNSHQLGISSTTLHKKRPIKFFKRSETHTTLVPLNGRAASPIPWIAPPETCHQFVQIFNNLLRQLEVSHTIGWTRLSNGFN